MSIVDDLMRAAFDRPRTPRSDAYKAGVRAELEFRLDRAASVKCPFPPGTAESDAFFSGLPEGRDIYRTHMDRSAQRSES